MTKAIIDTTILTDILLNSGEAKENALKAMQLFDQTLLPVYAIKEFKAGPLSNFAWMHNKLATVDSFQKALEALQRMARTPRRYTTATAIQGLKEAAGSIGKLTPPELEKKYGRNANMDKILCDEFRYTLKVRIQIAWKKRREVTTTVIFPLTCYREVGPQEKRGMLDLRPTKCIEKAECTLTSLIKSRREDLPRLRIAIHDSQKLENLRRAKILHELYRKPGMEIQDKECRDLGDAVFVLLAPEDGVVLTTNVSDHAPLAEAIGRKAVSPSQLLSEKS